MSNLPGPFEPCDLEVREVKDPSGMVHWRVFLNGDCRNDLSAHLWGRNTAEDGGPGYWFIKVPHDIKDTKRDE